VSALWTQIWVHIHFGSKIVVDYILDIVDTIEFGRFFVEANEAKFQHGMDLDDFRTNFCQVGPDQNLA